jgi:hypothetical protein
VGGGGRGRVLPKFNKEVHFMIEGFRDETEGVMTMRCGCEPTGRFVLVTTKLYHGVCIQA